MSSLLSRVFKSVSRNAIIRGRNLITPSAAPPQHHLRHFHCVSYKASSLSNVLRRSPAAFTHCGMSTSAPNEQDQEKKGDTKEDNTVKQTDETSAGNQADETSPGEPSGEAQESGSNSDSQATSESGKRRRPAAKRTAFSDSDSENDIEDLSREELVKVLFEKEEVLQKKEKEFGEWKDKFLRSYAEMENVMERTRRDAENSKKFAVQSFAKSLLDVADNLSRAASVTKESFSKIDVSNDTIGAVPVLKTLLEGVEMTEKQLAEVFRKSGIEKLDPTNEQFDPNTHNAVFQVPDNSKPPGTVAVVLKAGYKLHDRIIRPAEVGVTVEVENSQENS